MQMFVYILVILILTIFFIIFLSRKRRVLPASNRIKEEEKDWVVLGNLFWNVFNTSEFPILLLKDYRIVNCNRSAINLFGENAEEIIGKAPFDLSPEIQPDGSVSAIIGKELFDRILFDGVANFEWYHKKINGELFLAQVSASSFETNGIYYAAATIKDITKSRQEETELQNYRQKLEQLIEGKTFDLEQANQELQALNEELDVSNEELQAINEELYSTNEELECSNKTLSEEIEDHKKTQAEKYVIEEKLNQFISQSSEAIIIINEKGIVEDWNKIMAQITGTAKDKVVGKHIWDAIYMMSVDPSKADSLRESFKKNTLTFFEEIKSGKRKEQVSESQIRHHDSSFRYIRSTLFPIITDSGNYGGVIISDITEKKVAEAQLETYRNELEKLLEQRTERLEQLSARFNEVYSNSSDSITFMDILDNGRTIKVFDLNPVSKKLFKITDERLCNGVFIDELLPEIKIESFKQHILPKLLSGASVTFNNEIDTGNGYWNSTIYPIKNQEGNVYRIAAFSRNVTAEYEQEKLSAILSSAIESWPYEFWVSNKEGVCIIQNKVSQRLWGNRIGKKFTDINAPNETKQKTMEDESKALQGIPSCTELEFETPEGPRYVLVYTSPISLKNEITGFLGIIADITHQKKTEIALKESEKRLNQLLSSVTDYKFTVEIENGKVINTVHSEGCLAVTGYNPADFQSNPFLWFEMVHDDDKKYLDEWAGKVENGFDVEPFEHRIIRKDGETIWVSNTTVFKKDNHEKILGFDGLISDITKRKNAELALRESEKRFYDALDLQPLPIGIIIDGKPLLYNKSFTERFGYTIEDVPTVEKWVEKAIIDDNLREKILTDIQKAITRTNNYEITRYERDHKIRCNDGSEKWIEISDRRIGNMLITVFNDITERRQSEEKIRLSEEKYRLLAENIDDVIWKLDINTLKYTYFSPSINKLTGYSVEELQDLTPEQILMPESFRDLSVALPDWINHYNNTREGINRTFEYQIRHKNGDPVWVEINAAFVTDNSGVIKEIVATSRSIEERKASELALRKSEERYEQVTKLSGYVVYDFNIETKKITWAGAVTEVLGFTDDELNENGYEGIVNLMHPEDIYFFKPQSPTSNSIQSTIKQYRFLTKDKGYIWIETHAFLFSDSENKPYRWLGIMKDITEQLRIQSLITESEEKLRTIFETSKDGIVVIDNEMNVLEINPSALNRSGYQYEEVAGKTIFGFLLKENLPTLVEYLKTIGENKIAKTFETEIIIKNGGFFPVEISASTMNLNSKEVILILIRDISERKQHEKELLQSVINTEERERVNFSQELHDGLGPLLSAAKMYVEWLAEPGSNVDHFKIIPDIKKLLEESTLTVKDISFKLSPHILQNYGVVESLISYAGKVEKTGKTHINIEAPNIGRLEELTETIVYRVICECINNTLKHAKANTIDIKMNTSGNFLVINYSDDGKGFDVEKIKDASKGIGLLNMQSRLKSINGMFSIQSMPGKGTNVFIKVPTNIK